MKNKLNVALALFTGLAGGMLSRYITPQAAFAQTQAPAKEIRAQSLTLVDPSDFGRFSVDGNSTVTADDGDDETP